MNKPHCFLIWGEGGGCNVTTFVQHSRLVAADSDGTRPTLCQRETTSDVCWSPNDVSRHLVLASAAGAENQSLKFPKV